MFNSPVLDIAIGLVFIFLLYSLLATIIQEIIATKLAFRAKVLEKAIFRMLEDGKSSNLLKDAVELFITQNRLLDKRIAVWFYAHPLIKYLGEDNYQSKPSYISAQNFSKVMLDLLKGPETGVIWNEVQQINDSIQEGRIFHLPIKINETTNHRAIQAIQQQQLNKPEALKALSDKIELLNADTKYYIQSIWDDAAGDINKFKHKLEQWFDDTMDRASGWYKKSVQNVLFVIGLILAIGFNVDTISIVKKLRHDPQLREQMVQSAGVYLEKNQQLYTPSDSLTAAQRADSKFLQDRAQSLVMKADTLINTDLNNVNQLMGLGWSNGFLCLKKNGQDATAIIGWLITALALSLGAPFWFDLLNKLMKLRGTGNKDNSTGTSAETAMANSPSSPTVAPSIAVNVNTQTGNEEAVG